MPLMSKKYAMVYLRVAYEWNRHCRFIGLLEPQLDDAFSDWQRDVGKWIQETEDEAEKDPVVDLYKDSLIDYYVEGSEDFKYHKVILVNSFFTASWALFEEHLTSLCRLVEKRGGPPFPVGDLRGSATGPVKDYLKKLGIPFPDGSAPEWARIKKYRAIRNMIVHQGAAVSCTWKGYKWAEAKGIVNDGRRIPRFELTRSFCLEAADDCEEFLSRVIDTIAQRKSWKKSLRSNA